MTADGSRLAVWAPLPEQVEAVVGERRVSMTRDARGWWRTDECRTPEGTRYGFSIDGGPARPDPRSPSQPEGVDGLSAVVDQGAFVWTDAAWRGVSLRGAVLYELHIGTFTPEGTFDGAIERIPHLVDLGIDAVELLPVAEFAGTRGWGYDGVDLFAPHHAYGGPDGLKRLVDACHAHGIGVVIDVVYNHLGPAGNYLGEFAPYFSDRHQTNWGAGVNFDGPGSDEVRAFVIDNAIMWLRDYHADGLRLDAVHAIVDDSALHLLEELANAVDALGTRTRRPRFLIAESDLNDPRFVRDPSAGGFGLDAAWADEWHHALHAALTGEQTGYYEDFGSLEQLAKALRQAWVYDGIWSRHRQRHHGASPAGLAGYQFVVSTQNHDQVGNRAVGDRLGSLTTAGRVRVAAALLLCSPFTPMLFQGEEWGATTPFLYFTDHEAELGRAVSEGRRKEFAYFGWDPQAVPDPQAASTFTASKLDWTEAATGEHASLLAWYRLLIGLRRKYAELGDPRLDRTTVDVDPGRSTLDIARPPTRLLVNLGDVDAAFTVASTSVMIATSHPNVRREGTTTVVVPADAVAIVRDVDTAPGDRDA